MNSQNLAMGNNGSTNVRRASRLVDDVFRLLWRKKRMSRADIARELNLSRSTASKIVDTLLETRLIAEIGTAKSTGGRKPIVLEFQDDARGILGVDLGASHIAVALTNMRGRVYGWVERDHPVRMDPEGTRSLVIEMCENLIDAQNRPQNWLLSVGVSVPSPVDPLQPRHLSEVVIPAWQGRSGIEQLESHFKVPVFIDNDANLGTLAEFWWGAGRNRNHFVYIKISTGIGAGYVLNGDIYRGANGFAGEMGHVSLDPNGELCVCGLRGCLATKVTVPAMIKRAKTLLGEFPASSLIRSEINQQSIADAAMDGDPLAERVIQEVATSLSTAIIGWLNLMNPELVVVGSGSTHIDNLVLPIVRQKIGKHTLVQSAAAEIQSSQLGNQGVAIGAATLVIDRMISDPQFILQNYSVEYS
jgi:predicted NBD/HSP70 family sugar kinase